MAIAKQTKGDATLIVLRRQVRISKRSTKKYEPAHKAREIRQLTYGTSRSHVEPSLPMSKEATYA